MTTRTFAITADDEPVALDDNGSGQVAVNVSNTSAPPTRAGARLMPMGTTKREWLRIEGEVERNFSGHESHQFVVRITAPSDTPSGKYSFRLNMVSVQNPDEDYTEGPVMSFELRGSKPPPAQKRRQFPWVYLLLAFVVLGGAVILAISLSSKGAPELGAAFNTSATQGFAPLTVTFSNLTSGEFNQVLWNFGDGEIATNRDTDHVFTKAGVYVVTLLVIGDQGYAVATNTVSVQEKAKPSPAPQGAVFVPNVLRLKRAQAMTIIIQSRLKVGNVTRTPRFGPNPVLLPRTVRDTVLDQSPRPGSPVSPGTKVDLTYIP